MRKIVLFFWLFLGSVAGFTQGAVRVRRPVIDPPPLPTGRANIWYVIVPLTVAVIVVVSVCLRIRKRAMARRYASAKSRRPKKRSSNSSGRSSASRGSSPSVSSRSIPSSTRSSFSSSEKSSSGQRGSRWTATLDKQTSDLLPGQPDVFYMPTPDLEGKFHATIQKFRTNDRLYQFVVLPDTPAEAILRFAGNEAELRTACASPAPEWQMLCEVSGAPGTEEAGFTQQTGKAVLEEGVWVIKEKIRLRFNS